jgi:hypothetical protein
MVPAALVAAMLTFPRAEALNVAWKVPVVEKAGIVTCKGREENMPGWLVDRLKVLEAECASAIVTETVIVLDGVVSTGMAKVSGI